MDHVPAAPDAAETAIAAGPQRARGALRLGFGRRDGATVLAELYQSGCLKLRLPRVDPGERRVAVLLNTGGGVAGGDRLHSRIDLAAGTRAVVTTQAAERLYRARPDDAPALLETALQVGPGAALDWLPQETILFDRLRARRRLTIDLAADARFVGVESVLFGRRLMGEQVRTADWHDLIRLRRDGRLLLHDATRIVGDAAAILSGRATAAGRTAAATLLYAGPDAAALLAPLRAALAAADAAPGADAGASRCDDLLLARVLADDSARLRRIVVAGLAVLRHARPLPRIWHT